MEIACLKLVEDDRFCLLTLQRKQRIALNSVLIIKDVQMPAFNLLMRMKKVADL